MADADPLLTSLETARLRLILPTEDMAEATASFLLRNRERFAPIMARPSRPVTPEICLEQIREARREAAAGRALRMVMVARDDRVGLPIGTVALANIIRGPLQAATVGYKIDGAHEGRGLMAEALRRVIRHAFEDLGLHRLMAGYLPTNERSGLLLRHLGFTIEGYARDYLFLDGVWKDHILTALVSTSTAPR